MGTWVSDREYWEDPNMAPLPSCEVGRRATDNQHPYRWWRADELAPRALLELDRHDKAARLFLEGLYLHYADCVATGRVEIWAQAAHASVDLMSSVWGLETERRGTVSR